MTFNFWFVLNDILPFNTANIRNVRFKMTFHMSIKPFTCLLFFLKKKSGNASERKKGRSGSEEAQSGRNKEIILHANY